MVEAYEIAVKVSEFFSNVYNHCGMDNLGKIDGSSGLVGLF
jgi:anti-sigma regulatory factor (Ser/Thr protein kinase)